MTTNYVKKIGYIIAAFLGLTLVVMVHEFGHYSACKLFGVRTPVFSIGFPPKIVGYKVNNTSFQIGALFIGGYVSINQYDFSKLVYLQKMIIILAGILFNLLFVGLYYIIRRYFMHADKIDNIIEEPENKKIYLNSVAPASVKELLKDYKKSLIGPIGIISLIAQGACLGSDAFFYFLALISLNLAIFNILPIPFLDGGEALDVTLKAVFGNNMYIGLIINSIYLLLVALWVLWTRSRVAKK